MEALVRVQTRMCQERASRNLVLSHEPNTEYCYYSRENIENETEDEDEDVLRMQWDDHPQTAQNIRALLHKTKEAAALKRETTALADAFSHQVNKNSPVTCVCNFNTLLSVYLVTPHFHILTYILLILI